MPSTSVKKLYLATNLNDLDSKVQIDHVKTRPTKNLVQAANKLIKVADECFLDEDEEQAYVQYMKFVELILIIRKRNDFKISDEAGKQFSTSANNALGRLEKLKASLKKRYSILEEANCLTKNEKNDFITAHHISKPDVIIPPSEPIISDIKLVEDVPRLSISSENLLSLLTSGASFIIIDIRPSNDFKDSHIKCSRCINVPEDVLDPGTTAAKLESVLPQESLTSWYKRDTVDNVILVDWESRDENTPNPRIKALKEAMDKWDVKHSLKKPPLLLEGGYKDWMLKYPMYTTQPRTYSINYENDQSPKIADLSDIVYPTIDENNSTVSPQANKENLNGPGPLFKKMSIPNHAITGSHLISVKNGRNVKSAPSVDRKSKPILDKAPKSSQGERETNHTPSIQPLNQTLNRNSTAEKNLHTNDTRRSSVERITMENYETAKELLYKEKEIENLRLRKELEAEESKRIEVQKQEDRLMERVKQLESVVAAKDAALAELKERKTTQKENIPKGPSETELKIKDMQEEVKKLREDRKRQEQKKKIESLKTNGQTRDIASANSALKRNPGSNRPQDHKNVQNGEYSIPLMRQSSTESSGRGLVRSHSSPNIAQLVNEEGSPIRKVPHFDRNQKPKPTQYKTRNVQAVYGVNNRSPPATGLKNLGNTCFMNSIIQCLSNTTPLAEYFQFKDYDPDINRENKQGTGGELAEEFAFIIKTLWSVQYKSFSPKDFKNTVSRCLSVCIGNEQQDSHEFLVVLMEKLHADLNKKSAKPIPKLEESVEETAFWLHHRKYYRSPISDIFDGLLKSTLTCLSCRQTSNSFEVFSCLSLPILTSRCSLKDCFQLFLKPEKISGEAAWDCPRCKQKKEAEKRLYICQVPDILVIQLKRFSYEGLWRRKLQTCVDFDSMLEVPYLRNNNPGSRRYSLYGIVNHFGTLEGGHYTAYCSANNSRKWYKYDDHEVYEIGSSDIVTSAAYILFYRAADIQSSL